MLNVLINNLLIILLYLGVIAVLLRGYEEARLLHKNRLRKAEKLKEAVDHLDETLEENRKYDLEIKQLIDKYDREHL